MNETPRRTIEVTERRLVTVLFADIVESTHTAALHDADKVRAGLALVFDRVRQVLETHGGTVEKFIGDAVMAVFGIPRGHDDDPERAVRAALALQGLCTDLSFLAGFPVALRIGINTGEVTTGQDAGRDFLVTGLPVNVAARLFPAAEPGEILVGPLTRRLTVGVVRYDGPLPIEGKGTGPIEAWTVAALVTAEPGAPPRGIEGLNAPTVGREAELRLLDDALLRVERDGSPQLVTVVGEAGIGKSRLLREFAARVLPRAEVRTGRSLPYGDAIEAHAVRSILLAEAAATGDGAAADLERRVRALIPEDQGAAVADRLTVLAGQRSPSEKFGDMSAEELAAEQRWAFRRFFEAAACVRPRVLVFEDIHWAPPSLLDLIEEAAEHARAPLLICCLARPELLERRQGWGAQGAHATTIRLQTLGPAASEELLRELLRVAHLPSGLVDAIVSRSGGNPLYVEELIRSLLAAGHITHEADGWAAAEVPDRLDVPDTLRGVIAARLDRLQPPTRTLLQWASVLGRHVAAADIAALSDDARLPSEAVRDAVRAQFLIREETAPIGGGRYRFRHDVVRDAVYASIGKHERLRLHARAADVLSRETDGADDRSELAAYHLEQAFVLADELDAAEREELGRRAYRALIALATRERRRAGSRLAIAFYDRAEGIAMADPIPLAERKADAAARAIARHLPRHGDRDQTEIFAEVERLRPLGPTPELAQLIGMAAQHDRERDSALANESMAMARSLDEPEAIAWTAWLACPIVERQDKGRGVELLKEAAQLAREHELRLLLPTVLQQLATIALSEGRISDNLALNEEAYQLAKSVGAKQHIASAALGVAGAHGQVLDREAMAPYLDEAIAAARDFGLPYHLAGVLQHAGWLELVQSDLDRARDHALESLSLIDADVFPHMATLNHGNLVLIYVELHDLEHAAEHERAMRSLRASDWSSITMDGISGALAAAEGRLTEAEALFRGELERIGHADPTIGSSPLSWNWYRALAQERFADFLMSQGRGAEAKTLLLPVGAYWHDPLAWRRRERLDAKLRAIAATR